ncbi:hypothetical protein [Halobellus captivus]|uniref:hypothetical protein n=1 Tax=Halobellus captivus TaxID=2592614 RepID=UPI001EF131B3|nr:hypothetical protein [Halobellus captivus]
MVDWLRSIAGRIAAPLRADPENSGFRLSSPETGTTTIDGDVGWASRPPAIVLCGRCGSDVSHRSPHDDIDCARCTATFGYDEFPDLELRYFRCPVCGSKMEHGHRHPHTIKIPEWATCHGCRYHWEFKHEY